jgi:pyruvate dehydrogenase E2 component (dihydrolipoyllysine-residue acetyltransferase)
MSSPAQEQAAASEDRRVPLSRHRRAVMSLMTESGRIPQFVLYRDVELRRLSELRESAAPTKLKLSYSDALVASCARALRTHNSLNASFDQSGACLIEHGRVNVGLAVEGPNGLIVVVVRDADQRTAQELARERERLTRAAREGALRSRDLTDATFVISNLGPAGISMFQALLTPPLVAILAVGAIRPRASRRGAPVVTLGLTLDHRAIDGLAGAAFLTDVADSLERPDWMDA